MKRIQLLSITLALTFLFTGCLPVRKEQKTINSTTPNKSPNPTVDLSFEDLQETTEETLTTKESAILNLASDVIPSESLINLTSDIQTDTATVTKIVDGDTIVININGVDERIRLIGIDTPESKHPKKDKNVPEGKIAAEFTRQHLLHATVEIEFDVQARDKYDRLLGYVWKDGLLFNALLLQTGMAKVSTYPPNVKYVNQFTAIQEQAINNEVGFWAGLYKNDVTAFGKISYPKPQAETPVQNDSIDQTNLQIKGNKNSKVYHLPGQRDYDNISSKNTVLFETEADALAAGYRKAKQ